VAGVRITESAMPSRLEASGRAGATQSLLSGDRVEPILLRRTSDDLGAVRKTRSVREQDRCNDKSDQAKAAPTYCSPPRIAVPQAFIRGTPSPCATADDHGTKYQDCLPATGRKAISRCVSLQIDRPETDAERRIGACFNGTLPRFAPRARVRAP
jgi:hypothetical protein